MREVDNLRCRVKGLSKHTFVCWIILITGERGCLFEQINDDFVCKSNHYSTSVSAVAREHTPAAMRHQSLCMDFQPAHTERVYLTLCAQTQWKNNWRGVAALQRRFFSWNHSTVKCLLQCLQISYTCRVHQCEFIYAGPSSMSSRRDTTFGDFYIDLNLWGFRVVEVLWFWICNWLMTNIFVLKILIHCL